MKKLYVVVCKKMDLLRANGIKWELTFLKILRNRCIC